jgi:hypothetical protein
MSILGNGSYHTLPADFWSCNLKLQRRFQSSVVASVVFVTSWYRIRVCLRYLYLMRCLWRDLSCL